MHIKRLFPLAALSACAFLWAGCSHGGAALSPLVGSWKINASAPSPSEDTPQFTSLRFKSDGTLSASYVATGGALSHIGSAPQIKEEDDTFSLGDASTLHITEGTRSLDYTYDIHDGKLFLTPSNASNAIVYLRVSNP